MTAEHLGAAYDVDLPSVSIASSGFSELDSITGGMTSGRVWILVGVPGQGRTTLLTQWAAAIAGQANQTVHLVTPREGPSKIVARLLSLLGRLPLHRLTAHTLDASHAEVLGRAREHVEGLSLCLYAEGEDTYVPEVHPFRARMKPTAVVIDDADLVCGLTPMAVADYAAKGMFVLISLPRHQIMATSDDEADLDPVWARTADVILEVRHRGLPGGEARPGEADLHVHHNRWGFLRTIPVQYQGHFSRFQQPVP